MYTDALSVIVIDLRFVCLSVDGFTIPFHNTSEGYVCCSLLLLLIQ